MKRLALLLIAATTIAAQSRRPMTYSTLTEGQTIGGFRTTAVYRNDSWLRSIQNNVCIGSGLIVPAYMN